MLQTSTRVFFRPLGVAISVAFALTLPLDAAAKGTLVFC